MKRKVTPHSRWTLLAALLATLLAPLAVFAADGETRWVSISNGESVGHLHANRAGDSVSIDYYIDDNGRGPKIKEQIRLDQRGYPLEWTITGTSLFGAAIDEAYRWQGGRLEWHSQADRGQRDAAVPPMYVGGDDSPWSLGMYARALLAAEGQAIEVVPSGRLRLEKVADRTVGADALTITFYELSGLGLEPELFALDREGELFASLGGRGALIRAGYESAVPELLEWARAHELDRMRALQQRLAHRFEQPVRYVNVRVFDPVSRTSGEPTSVKVVDGRIAEVGPAAASSGEVVIDGAGGTLVAGLADMHAHNSLDSGLYWLAAGVTLTRDMGNDNALLADILAAIDSGELPGPRIVPAGLIEARSPYSARIGIVAENLEEALAAEHWYAEHGYQEIKTYNSMIPEWVAPLAAEARKLGLRISGHVPAFMSPDDVIAAGYNSIAHINQLMLGWLLEPGEDTRTPLRLTAMKRAANLDLSNPRVQHTIALMREHGTALDTTAVILERLMLSRAGEVQRGDAPYLEHMPIGYQRYRKRSFVPLDQPGDDAAYRAGVDRMLEVIRLLHDNGIGLLIGTDDTTGFTVHRELELYAMAGIPNGEVLSIATLGAARYLGQADRLGSLEPGKLADFLLVDGDPVTDISAIRKVRAVSRGGVVYFPDEVYEAIGIVPFAAKPEVRMPAPSLFDPTRVDSSAPAPLTRTRHEAEFNGKRIRYEVVTGEFVLSGEDGQPAATMFSTSYIRTGQRASRRPVLFLFNGGPGASSSPLHLGTGPVRRPPDDPDGSLVTYSGSALDATDMVFVDPVGTGYSRLYREDAGAKYFGIEQDADAVLAFISDWLVREGRKDSPLYVMGESYGSVRAIALLHRAKDVHFSGALLLSPAVDMTAGTPVVGNNLPYVFRLPSMAATAVYHGVVEAGGSSFSAVFDAAADFAQAEYSAALYQGNLLPADAKQAMAQRLAALTGLPAADWLEHNLRIDARTFLDTLLAREEMRVGYLDSRRKGPIAEYRDQRPPQDDPGFGSTGEGRSTGELLDEYFRDVLGTVIERPYRTLNLHANSQWDYGQKAGLKMYYSVAPLLEEAMQRDPQLRIWVGGGIFDLATPIMAARYIMNQLDVAPDRFVFRGYEAGHTVFDHEDSRLALSADIRSFVGGE